MTLEDIDKLEAGPELDRLIAEKIMRWDYHPYQLEHKFSSSMRGAWKLVEKLNPIHPLIMTWCIGSGEWWVVLPNETEEYRRSKDYGPGKKQYVEAFAKTAPLAICRAALKTLTGEWKS